MSEDEELARLRNKRQSEIEQQSQQKAQMEAQQQIVEQQKQRLLATFLTDEARTRLANIKMANPEYADTLENRLIQIGQSGQLQGRKITDEQLKSMLRQVMSSRKETKINIQRK
jgi:programmed cell death protein 5